MDRTVWTQRAINQHLSIASTHKDENKRVAALTALYRAGLIEKNDTIVDNPDGTVTFLDGPKTFTDKCRRIMAGEDPFLFDEELATEAGTCKDCRHTLDLHWHDDGAGTVPPNPNDRRRCLLCHCVLPAEVEVDRVA